MSRIYIRVRNAERRLSSSGQLPHTVPILFWGLEPFANPACMSAGDEPSEPREAWPVDTVLDLFKRMALFLSVPSSYVCEENGLVNQPGVISYSFCFLSDLHV